MPILVQCPACAAKMNAPDAAAGHRVKCPKCAAIIPVPAAEANEFEVVDDEPQKRALKAMPMARPVAKPVSPKNGDEDEEEAERPRRRRRDEDEDDFDDRPTRKSGRKEPTTKKGGIPVWVFAVAGGAALLVVAGVVAVLVAFGGKPTGPGGILGPSAPAGYTAVREPAGGFAVFLPGATSKVDVKIKNVDGAKLGHHAWAGHSGGGFDAKGPELDVWVWSRPIPAGFNPGTDPDQLLTLLAVYEHDAQSGNTFIERVGQRAVTLGGKPGAEFKLKQKPHLMSKPGDNGFFADHDREEMERIAREGLHHVFYVTHNGKQVFIVRVSRRQSPPPDDVLKTIADSFSFI